ncbi:hypothetical protein [Caballeronia sordidicola]|uniref:Uncharacterized protein n=1 Tax=Caballeronia sordidicola TaxID=196367 RepID=A0A242MM31_CABSO|nr:hypothetical protein [Caballeronia sordidicola]OTP72377.1 hypothetical protein PAMC26510_21360 [Caballeronia sordidicola]
MTTAQTARLARLEAKRNSSTKPNAPVDPLEAERIYRELIVSVSTAAPALPADPNEAATIYLAVVAGAAMPRHPSI